MAARTRTTTQLIEGGRRKADAQTETDRHTAAECLDYCNAGIAFVARTLSAVQGYAFYGRTWYVLGDVTAAGAAPENVTITGTPVDEYSVVVTITDASTPAAIAYTISVDGGASVATSGNFDDSVGDTVALAGTGLTVDFPIVAGAYADDQVYTASTEYPTLTPNLRWTALPSDVMHVHAVSIVYSGSPVQLEQVNQQDEASLEDDSSWPQLQYPLKYRFRGTSSSGAAVSISGGPKLDLYPRPRRALDLILKYTPHPGVFASGEAWDGICGHEDAVESWIAREIFRKDREGEWVDRESAYLAKWEADLRIAAQRVTGDPWRVKPRASYMTRVDPRMRWGR